MLIMTKYNDLPDTIHKILDQNPAIRVNMSRGLINIRALAKYIIKERKIDASLDAVVSAIRRYKIDSYNHIFENALNLIKKSLSISTMSSLAIITATKDDEIQKLLPKLFSIIRYSQGNVLRIIQANESIKIIIDEKNLEKIIELFPPESIQDIEKHLAEINLRVHSDAKYTLGVSAIISNELAINGVNIIETMSCFPEALWFIDEKNLLKAYNALDRLRKQDSILY
jgi:aspartokinase